LRAGQIIALGATLFFILNNRHDIHAQIAKTYLGVIKNAAVTFKKPRKCELFMDTPAINATRI
jgi:hypothetical protein